MKQLLEAGVHFGHQTRRWNPKMAPYIFTERNGIYIIDLQKTVKKIDEAYNFMMRGCSNRQTDSLCRYEEAGSRSNSGRSRQMRICIIVNERWLGGMLTNYKTIATRIKRLNDIKMMEEDGTFDKLSQRRK